VHALHKNLVFLGFLISFVSLVSFVVSALRLSFVVTALRPDSKYIREPHNRQKSGYLYWKTEDSYPYPARKPFDTL
jgi:hypothetical protein